MTNIYNSGKLKASGKATGTFYFKHFGVKDDRSTMKVGTDAVLLGAAVDVAGAASILDIGTGCGVIALMLAQRSDALIEAIDIDEESVKQAKENVVKSPWKERINVINVSLQDYADVCSKKYDLIVSNPPYFSNSLKSPSQRRNLSRHDHSLRYDDLIRIASQILNPNGSFWVILPEAKCEEFIQKAGQNNLFPSKLLYIIPKPNRNIQLVIIRFDKCSVVAPVIQTLHIKNENNSYSKEYKNLTGEFYLDF